MQALDVIINTGLMAGEAELDAALDWVATQFADPEDDFDYRSMTGNLLLDFPRERCRARLEQLAEGLIVISQFQTLTLKLNQ